jgi:hypothetical protein
MGVSDLRQRQERHMKIDLDTVTSAAIRTYSAAKLGLESEIDAIRTDAAASASDLNKSGLLAKIKELDPNAAHLYKLTQASPRTDLVDFFAAKTASLSEPARRLSILRESANADRNLANFLNRLVESGEMVARELREIVARDLHKETTAISFMAEVTKATHWGRFEIVAGKAASDLIAGYHRGKDLREVATLGLRKHLANVMRFPNEVASNGFGGTRIHDDAFVNAVASRMVIKTISKAYEMDESFTFPVFELDW